MKYLMSVAAGVLLMGGLSLAQAEESGGCVDVQVDGYKSPDYNCLSKQMGNNPDGAKAAQKNQERLNVPIDKRPPSQMGLATPAATGTRMGNSFGTSVKPQRPASGN